MENKTQKEKLKWLRERLHLEILWEKGKMKYDPTTGDTVKRSYNGRLELRD